MLKKYTPLLLLIVSFLSLTSTAFAQYTYTASGRLVQTQEALLQRQGSFAFFSRTDFNFLPEAYRQNGVPVAHSLIRNSIHADYSLFDVFQVSANAMLYQDLNHRDRSNSVLNHVTIVGKLGSLTLFSDNFYAGVLTSVMIPTGGDGVWNSYGNPYSAGGYEFGANLLLSYYFDEIFPNESISISGNFGYYNFNDVGGNLSNLSDRKLLNEGANTASINYSLGVKIPLTNFDIMLEYWGWNFTTLPPPNAYTRLDNVSFASAAFRFRTSRMLSVLLGFEYRVTGGNTSNTAQRPNFGIVPRPNSNDVPYTNWRGIIGLEFNFPTFRSTSYGGASGIYGDDFGIEGIQGQGTYSLIRKIQEIDEDKESIARKIEEFRRRRQSIETNLEQIRRSLNESKKKDDSSTPKENEPAKPDSESAPN